MLENPPVVDIFERRARDHLLMTAATAVIIVQWVDNATRVQPAGSTICPA